MQRRKVRADCGVTSRAVEKGDAILLSRSLGIDVVSGHGTCAVCEPVAWKIRACALPMQGKYLHMADH